MWSSESSPAAVFCEVFFDVRGRKKAIKFLSKNKNLCDKQAKIVIENCTSEVLEENPCQT
jgi:hypothetical protein